MSEYIGKLYRKTDGIYIETLNNNLIKVDIDIDDALAKDSLLGENQESFDAMLEAQLVLAGLSKR